jgi:PhnB protein
MVPAPTTGGRNVSRVSTYLNFMGDTEEAFDFYASVFGTEFSVPIMRVGDMPPPPGTPPIPEHELAMVMHVELPILDGHVLMGTDMLESMGHELRIGNNTTLNLEPDSRAEAERLFAALSEGGSDTVGLDPMPWGSLWGVTLDRFGVRWMFNVSLEAL